MKQNIIAAVLVASTFSLIACEKGSDEAPKEEVQQKVALDDGSAVVATGETAKEYYSHFLLNKVSYCPNPWYRFAGVYNFELGNDELGRQLLGQLGIMMFDNGQYFAYYAESSLQKTKRGFKEVQRLHMKLKRHWSYKGKEIVFEDLGTGSALVVSGMRTIQLKAERNIIRDVLKNRVLEVRPITSNEWAVPDLDLCETSKR